MIRIHKTVLSNKTQQHAIGVKQLYCNFLGDYFRLKGRFMWRPSLLNLCEIIHSWILSKLNDKIPFFCVLNMLAYNVLYACTYKHGSNDWCLIYIFEIEKNNNKNKLTNPTRGI